MSATMIHTVLSAQALDAGRAQRTARLRHFHVTDEPLGLCGFRLGAEDYSVAALAFGPLDAPYGLWVPGQPLNRQLTFDALADVARLFNAAIEKHIEVVEVDGTDHDGEPRLIASSFPQIVVPNEAHISWLRALGRRLAYLSPYKGVVPEPELVRMGRHLQWLGEHAHVPGQQVIIPLATAIADHWATGQSPLEREHLPALEAWVDPPSGVSGFEAAAGAENVSAGPTPEGADDEAVDTLIAAFDAARAGRTDPAAVAPLKMPIFNHYDPQIDDVWEILQRGFFRERDRFTPAPSTARRALEDQRAYTRHMNHMNGPSQGRRRVRQDAFRIATAKIDLERQQRVFDAEQVIDDPLRRCGVILAGRGLDGEVITIDTAYRERARVNMVRKAVVSVHSPEPVLMPVGMELYWANGGAAAATYTLHDIQPATNPDGSPASIVVLKSRSFTKNTVLPTIGDTVAFCDVDPSGGYRPNLAPRPPWVFQGPGGGAGPAGGTGAQAGAGAAAGGTIEDDTGLTA